ncbi:hypothetical protein HB837_14750 [Listeria innocua]|uniref:hypothetical protein n=1 Tax=Listeria innocua TaxID=1642 RepID=UPI0012F10DDA|nr:hypothetical protein [Listeria innocua]ECB9830336.1 hypothetical protein [Listeria monocytogenes]MBC1353696.1 hypothetical protein [Listeria innocua]
MNSTNFMLFEEDRLHQFVEAAGHHFTEDIQEAMFLWPNGDMTSSNEYGIRGDDHNVLSSYFEYLDKDEIFEMSRHEILEVAAATVGTVLLSPESQTASIAENQAMTEEQQEILENSSYQIEYFTEGISQNQGLKKLNMDELTMNSTNYILFDEEALNQFVYDNGYHFTKDANEAMFLWPNGEMTSSNEAGVRGDSHNVLSSYFEYLDKDEVFDLNRNELFEVAAATTGTIIMAPETQTALIAKNQTMTSEQEAVLENSSYSLGYFSNGMSQNDALEKLDLDQKQVEDLKDKGQNQGINH